MEQPNPFDSKTGSADKREPQKFILHSKDIKKREFSPTFGEVKSEGEAPIFRNQNEKQNEKHIDQLINKQVYPQTAKRADSSDQITQELKEIKQLSQVPVVAGQKLKAPLKKKVVAKDDSHNQRSY